MCVDRRQGRVHVRGVRQFGLAVALCLSAASYPGTVQAAGPNRLAAPGSHALAASQPSIHVAAPVAAPAELPPMAPPQS